MSNEKSNQLQEKLSRRAFVKAGMATGATAAVSAGTLLSSDTARAASVHAHGHAHPHEFTEPPPDIALRVKSLESLLIDKQIVPPFMFDYVATRYQEQVGPQRGKKIVARAWLDPELRERMLTTVPATEVLMEILEEELADVPAPPGMRIGSQDSIRVVENTSKVHNLIVCTLCSCYPWAILGLPPAWYKSAPYRSRAVSDPRSVLAEFGTELDDDVEIRVWDTNSEMWYLVLPERPEGTEGWTEEQLMDLITVNSMVGVQKAKDPRDVGGN